MKIKLLPVALGLVLGCPNIQAVVIDYRYGTANDFVENFTGVDQAFLLVSSNAASQGNYNTGGYNGMLVGRNNARQGVVSFDLSSMQGKAASIDSAQLTFYRTGAATDVNFTISMYAIYGTNAGWNQGTGTGIAVGPDNSVTYLNQNYSSVGSENVPWKNNSGDSVTNFSGAYNTLSVLDSVTYTTTSTSITFSIPVALVESWISSPSTNAGLAFIPSGAGVTTSSNANLGGSSSDEAFRPLLSLTYTPIPEPGAVGSLILGALTLFLAHRNRRP